MVGRGKKKTKKRRTGESEGEDMELGKQEERIEIKDIYLVNQQ